MRIDKEIALTFDDVVIQPRISNVQRGQITVKPKQIKDIHTYLPIISSPMSTVTGIEMVKTMNSMGCLGAHHRYCDIDTLLECSKLHPSQPIAVGTLANHQDKIDRLLNVGHYFFIIDVAHGGHYKAVDTVRYIRSKNSDVIIMSGNVVDKKSIDANVEAGANIIRVGIGSGSACLTRVNIGVGLPSISAILETREHLDRYHEDKDIVLAACGGIRNTGDLNKAIMAGADYVILGSMLAATDEAPGKEYYINDKNEYVIFDEQIFVCTCGGCDYHGCDNSLPQTYKIYSGMASERSLVEENGKTKQEAMIEGDTVYLPYKGSVRPIVTNIEKSLQQAMFYTGCENIKMFQTIPKFRQVTNAGLIEGTAHAKGLK